MYSAPKACVSLMTATAKPEGKWCHDVVAQKLGERTPILQDRLWIGERHPAAGSDTGGEGAGKVPQSVRERR